MPQQLDITKLHTKIIKAITGPEKQFQTKRGICEKYKIIFQDGYEAEYCPVVGEYDPRVKTQQAMTFRIGHRGNFGDEIEPAFSQSEEPVSHTTARSVTNMNSHPAVIALHASLRFHAEVKKDKTGLDDILADAEVIQDWLDKQTNITNL